MPKKPKGASTRTTRTKIRRARRPIKAKSKLLDFLVGLAENKRLQAAFTKDPHKAMTEAGLTPRQQKALMSGDLARIRNLFPGAKIHLPPNTTIKCTLIVIKF